MIREIFGRKSIIIDVSQPNLQAVLDTVIKQYPEIKPYLVIDNQINSNFTIAVNKQRIDPTQDFQALQLKTGDEVAILPPTGGG